MYFRGLSALEMSRGPLNVSVVAATSVTKKINKGQTVAAMYFLLAFHFLNFELQTNPSYNKNPRQAPYIAGF
jgi:hypothetical protein